MNRRYALYQVPLLSFFSKEVYRDAALRWKGTGLLYLLLLLAVCWFPAFLRLKSDFSNLVREEAPAIISQIPEFRIQDGKASIDEPQPYYITNPETGEAIAVIDTTGTITSFEEAGAMCLITEDRLTYRQDKSRRETFEFKDIKEWTVDGEKAAVWLKRINGLMLPVIFPAVVLFSYPFRIIQALIYALIGILFARWCNSERSYVSLLRLAVVALTPALVVHTVLTAAEITLPLGGLWYFLASMGYLYFGVRAAGEEEAGAFLNGSAGG
ncbi:MAG: DUF1189 domain-containing protein [Kiritimatiellia bacterium]